MKTITLEPFYTNRQLEEEAFLGQAPTKMDAEIYLGQESLKVLRPDGSVLCVVLRGEMDKQLTKDYYKSIVGGKAIQKTDNRGLASGLERHNVVKEDGTVSNTTRTKGMVESSIVGFYDRYPRINYCRKTAWTQNNPTLWPTIEKYTEQVDALYKKHCPDKYKEHREIAGSTSPDFIIGDSCFTTITLNRNFRTHYHRDGNNLEQGLAAMSYMKTGKFTGGDIIFPNYKIGARLYNYDLIIFDNLEIHGNTPIVSMGEYQRITSVFFYRDGIRYCGTAEQELDRAKRNKGDNIIGPTTEDLNGGQFG